MTGHITGYAYDIAQVGKMIEHIAKATGCDVNNYPDACRSNVRLFNVTAPKWEFVAIGIKAEPCDVSCPCLMHNIETDDWAWSRSLVWFEERQGFAWNNGHYGNTKKEAKEKFAEATLGLLYYTEDF